MQTYAVYLRPRGSLASPIGSDTLFGAVCWGIHALQIKADVTGWLGECTSPPFAFSAVFPVWFDTQGQPLLRAYPLPAVFHATVTDIDRLAARLQAAQKVAGKDAKINAVREAKRMKRAIYLSEGLLAEVAEARLAAEDVLAELLKKSKPGIQQFGQVLMRDSEAVLLQAKGFDLSLPPNRSEPVQHNSVDRLAGATVEGLLFYQEETFFTPDTGLWALVRAEAADYEKLIRPALRYLEDTGFGANRSVGKGQFKIETGPAPALPAAQNANAVMMLSRYLPSAADGVALEGKPLGYQLVTLHPRREQKYPRPVAGQATPPIYKQPLRVFEAGAVFPLKKRQEIYGRLAQVVPEEQGGAVYQSGAALPLYLRLKEASYGK